MGKRASRKKQEARITVGQLLRWTTTYFELEKDVETIEKGIDALEAKLNSSDKKRVLKTVSILERPGDELTTNEKSRALSKLVEKNGLVDQQDDDKNLELLLRSIMPKRQGRRSKYLSKQVKLVLSRYREVPSPINASKFQQDVTPRKSQENSFNVRSVVRFSETENAIRSSILKFKNFLYRQSPEYLRDSYRDFTLADKGSKRVSDFVNKGKSDLHQLILSDPDNDFMNLKLKQVQKRFSIFKKTLKLLESRLN